LAPVLLVDVLVDAALGARGYEDFES